MLNLTQKKRIEAEKNYDKDGKVLYKLMNNADIKSKLYVTKKTFDSDLIVI